MLAGMLPAVVGSRGAAAVAAGPTWLSGSTIISTDQTWGPEGSPYNTGRLSVYGGRLVAQGSAGSPVVFTSYHDDSARGDSNGGGRAPARGDYWGLSFGAPSVAAAAEMPVSVLDNVSVRWGGEGGFAGCCYGSAIEVAQLGRLHVTRSEVTGAYAARFSASGLSPGLGTAMVSQTRFAESGCGAYLGSGGGDLVSSRFEASLGKAFQLNTTKGVHVYRNEVAATSEVAGTGGMTRESADVRGNALLGAVGDPPGGAQDHVCGRGSDRVVWLGRGEFGDEVVDPGVEHRGWVACVGQRTDHGGGQ